MRGGRGRRRVRVMCAVDRMVGQCRCVFGCECECTVCVWSVASSLGVTLSCALCLKVCKFRCELRECIRMSCEGRERHPPPPHCRQLAPGVCVLVVVVVVCVGEGGSGGHPPCGRPPARPRGGTASRWSLWCRWPRSHLALGFRAPQPQVRLLAQVLKALHRVPFQLVHVHSFNRAHTNSRAPSNVMTVGVRGGWGMPVWGRPPYCASFAAKSKVPDSTCTTTAHGDCVADAPVTPSAPGTNLPADHTATPAVTGTHAPVAVSF